MAIAFQAINSINTIGILDAHLNNLLMGYRPPNFIARDIFKQIPTSVDTARLVQSNAPLHIENDIQLSPTGFGTVKLNFSATDYYTLSYKGLQAALQSYDIQQLGGEARAREIVAYQLDDAIQLAREYAIASALTSVSVIAQNFAPTYAWDNYTSSDPVSDFATARRIVVGGLNSSYGCGYPPNVAIMNWDVYNALISNPQLIKAYYQSAFNPSNMILKKEQLAQVMGVEQVLIGAARYASNETNQTLTLSQVWNNSCIFAHINMSPNPNEAQQSLGYTFIPSTAEQGFPEVTYDWTTPGLLPQMGKFIVRAYKYDDHITDATCACLITTAITTGQ